MSTFCCSTITGLGLGAMYFLIASGLSLIYGLMGVLNFAHGAFISVGGYGTWWFQTNVFDGVDSLLWRWLLSALIGLVLGGVFAALVELVLIRPLYSRHIEQVLVTVGLQLAFVALDRRHLGRRREALHRSAVAARDDDRLRRAHPERPLGRDRDGGRRARAAPALPPEDALRADHPRGRREPRDGAGARHRRPQGVHARLRDRRHRRRDRRRPQRRLLQRRRPGAGDEPADLRVHRRRHRRARLHRRLRRRRGRRRPDAAVHELLRRRPGSATWSSCSCSASSCSRGRAASPARWSGHAHEPRPRQELAVAARRLRALAVVPKIAVDVPRSSTSRSTRPGRSRCSRRASSSAALALTYDIQFGYTGLLSFGHALYIASALPLEHRDHAVALAVLARRLFTIAVAFVLSVVLGFVSLRATGIAFAMVTLAFAQAGAVLALKDPHHWTHGEEGLGADYTKLPQAFVGIFNTKNLYWLALAFLAVVFFIVRWLADSSPGRVWGAIRDNEPRVEVLGMRPARTSCRPSSSRRCSPRRGGIVYMLLFNGSTLSRDGAELHADAAAHGRDRRRRLALGRSARRDPLHLPRRPARRDRQLVAGRRACRRRCARRSSSRSSCSASSSSSSSCSCPAGSSGSSSAAGRPGCAGSARRSAARHHP